MLTVLVHEYVLRSSLCKKASMQMQVSLWMIAPARQHVTLLCQQKDVERERERKLTYTYPREQFSCCRMTAKTPAYTESKRVQIVNLILATLFVIFPPFFVSKAKLILFSGRQACDLQMVPCIQIPHIHRQQGWVNLSCQMLVER
jgi:hypothetical protein